MSTRYTLAIIGFGNVGQGLTKIIQQQHHFLKENFGVDIQLVAVCDLIKGSVADPNGLDPNLLLQNLNEHGDLKSFNAPYQGWDAEQTIAQSHADILVELAFTDLNTGEPALSHLKQAIKRGMHVSMTNKGPVALHFTELKELANKHGVHIGIEGTVMSGTPCLFLAENMLAGANINQIQGILNGTTNFILGEMEKGISYQHALEKAQSLGYAEADPTGDVEGHDAAAKVVILGNLLLGLSLSFKDVKRKGISHLTNADIIKAKQQGCHWKLIGKVSRTPDGFEASVQPEMIDLAHPLASINGATNAITYSTSVLGDITLIGPGAGRLETGYAVIEDILSIHRSHPLKKLN